MSDEPVHDGDEGDDAPLSTRAKVGMWVVGIVLLLAAAYLMVRMSSPLIAADATPPPGHFSLPCSVCHRLGAAAAAGVTP